MLLFSWIRAWIQSWIRRLFAPAKRQEWIAARKRAEDLFDVPGPTVIVRKDASTAEWDGRIGMARVANPRGKIWNTTGVIRSSSLLCNVEETIYLVEQGCLILTLQGRTMDLHEVLELLGVEKNGCSMDAYNVYSHFKALGYVVSRHNVDWTAKEEPESIDRERDDHSSSSLKLVFDVYAPNSQFRKTSPGVPLFSLCVSRTAPTKNQVNTLERGSKVPVKFATVQGGHVGIFSFTTVELPCLS
ncbi:tRNA-splicing endonuclease subunit Sen54 [Selaginella moellendorffii]|nr:tRNA-splicing endonuclease subunit Sen54 [Selaginella moellendorffii]|eukprot:XP_002961843.2 tRNA-splicing endonuclease subunit Sen54 [Selaginella moellendorffii]